MFVDKVKLGSLVHKCLFSGFLRDLVAATFMASLLVVMHHRLPLIDVLDKFAFLFIAANSLQISADEPSVVVIGVDQKTFEQDFLEQSPLDRCVMAQKVEMVYSEHPSLLVIDFDLSPSLAGILSKGLGRSRDLGCEDKLYAILKQNAAETRTVLLQPFSVADEKANLAKQTWKNELERNGIFFGDGALPVQFGFVQQQYMRPNTLAAVAAAGSHSASEHVASDEVHISGTDAHNTNSENSHSSLQLLNFRSFGRDVSSLSWAQWSSTIPVLSLAGKSVFLGTAYGIDDRFLTPIDDLYGVNLHAAGFVSLRTPISLASASWGFLGDIIIGICFGVIVARFWVRYLKARLDHTLDKQNKRALAFHQLMILVAVYTLALWVLMRISVYVVANCNVWISPLPMALGMTLDAFVFGAIHAFEHATNHTANHDKTVIVIAVQWLKVSIWLLVVGYALLLIYWH